MSVLEDRLKVLLTGDAGSVDELCQQHPGEMGELARTLVDQAEAAAYKQFEQQQQQQQPRADNQCKELLIQHIMGLVKLLCVSSQQVHCDVVSQLARLAYCTPVLQQVTFPLDHHPAAVASVVALLRGFVRAPDSSSSGSSTAPSSTGPPPTLQAEAAAALVVLSSMGQGAKQLVGHAPDAIRGLAEAISAPPLEQYTTTGMPAAEAAEPGQAGAASSLQQQQQQQQQHGSFNSRPSNRQTADHGSWVDSWLRVSILVFVGLMVWCGVNTCSSTAGVGRAQQSQGHCWVACAEEVAQTVIVHARSLWQEWPALSLLMTSLWLLAPALLRLAVLCYALAGPFCLVPEICDLQQQWAAYCVHYLLVKHSANVNHVKRDKWAQQAIRVGASQCRPLSAEALLCCVLDSLGLTGDRQLAQLVPETLEPPPPPVPSSSWRGRLDKASTRLVVSAGVTSTFSPYVMVLGALLVICHQLWYLPHLSLYRGLLESGLVQTGMAWLCSAALYDALSYACVVWSCAAVVVLTLTSSTEGQPRVFHSRGAAVPAPWPLHTLLHDWADVRDGGSTLICSMTRGNSKGNMKLGGCTTWYIDPERRAWLLYVRTMSLKSWYVFWLVPLGCVAVAWFDVVRAPSRSEVASFEAYVMANAWWVMLSLATLAAWFHCGILRIVLLPLLGAHAAIRPHLLQLAAVGRRMWWWAALSSVLTTLWMVCRLVAAAMYWVVMGAARGVGIVFRMADAIAGTSWSCMTKGVACAGSLLYYALYAVVYSVHLLETNAPVLAKAVAASSWRGMQWLGGLYVKYVSPACRARPAAAAHAQNTGSGRKSRATTHKQHRPQQQRPGQSEATGSSAAPAAVPAAPQAAAAAATQHKPSQRRKGKQALAAGAISNGGGSSGSGGSSSMSREDKPGSSTPTPLASPRAGPHVNIGAAAGSSKQVAHSAQQTASSTDSVPLARPARLSDGPSAASAAVHAPASGATCSTSGTPQQYQEEWTEAVTKSTFRAWKQQQRQERLGEHVNQQQQPRKVQDQQVRSQRAGTSAAAAATNSRTAEGVDLGCTAGAMARGGSTTPALPSATQQAADAALESVAVPQQQQAPSSSSTGGRHDNGEVQPRPVQAVPGAAGGSLYLVQLVAAKRAAMAAAAAAAQDAGEQPPHVVHAAAAKAAAAAVEAAGGLPFVTASSIVAEAAAAAMGLLQEPPAATGSTAAAPGPAQEVPAATGSTGAEASSSLAGSGAGTEAAAGSKPSTAQASSSPGKPAPKKTRQPECVVCMDARACVRTEPCGHQVLCRGCAEQVASSKGKGECPMCRAIVEQYVVMPRTVQG